MKLKLIIERSHFIKHTADHWNVTLTFKMTSRQNIINTLYAEMCFFYPVVAVLTDLHSCTCQIINPG